MVKPDCIISRIIPQPQIKDADAVVERLHQRPFLATEEYCVTNPTP